MEGRTDILFERWFYCDDLGVQVAMSIIGDIFLTIWSPLTVHKISYQFLQIIAINTN